jgi:hypothetical protein
MLVGIEFLEEIRMRWTSVKKQLPTIPKDRYGVEVLIAVFDKCDESYEVRSAMFGKTRDRNGVAVSEEYEMKDAPLEDFFDLSLSGGSGYKFRPVFDVVTHWMSMPPPPVRLTDKCVGCEAISYCNSDC